MADLALWFVRSQGEVKGPVGGNTLKSWAKEGTLGPGDEVSQSASGPWHPASKVRGLFSADKDALNASKIAAKTAGTQTEATPPNATSVSDPASTEASPEKRKKSGKNAKSAPLTPADNRFFWAITMGVLSWFFVVPLTGLRGTWLYSTLAAAAIGYATTFFSNRKGEPPAWIGGGMALCGLLTVGGCLFGVGGVSTPQRQGQSQSSWSWGGNGGSAFQTEFKNLKAALEIGVNPADLRVRLQALNAASDGSARAVRIVSVYKDSLELWDLVTDSRADGLRDIMGSERNLLVGLDPSGYSSAASRDWGIKMARIAQEHPEIVLEDFKGVGGRTLRISNDALQILWAKAAGM